MRNSLQSAFDLELPATAIFDFPTAASLAQHIASRMAAAAPVLSVSTTEIRAPSLLANPGTATEIVGWAASAATPAEPSACA